MTKTTSKPPANPAGNGEGSSKLPLIIGGVVVALVVVIGLVALLWPKDSEEVEGGSGAEAASNSEQENASVEISGEDLPALPDTGELLVTPDQDPATGFQPPKLVGESFDGSEVVIDPTDGKPKLVVFLAHWCPHCQAEVPLLQDWIDSGDVPEGLEIYAVSTGVDSSKQNYPPSGWLASAGFQPPILLDDQAQSAASSWGLTGFPYFVMVDAEGNVWQRGSGEVPIADLQRLTEELVAGQASTGGAGSSDGLSSEVDVGAEPAPTTAAPVTAGP